MYSSVAVFSLKIFIQRFINWADVNLFKTNGCVVSYPCISPWPWKKAQK